MEAATTSPHLTSPPEEICISVTMSRHSFLVPTVSAAMTTRCRMIITTTTVSFLLLFVFLLMISTHESSSTHGVSIQRAATQEQHEEEYELIVVRSWESRQVYYGHPGRSLGNDRSWSPRRIYDADHPGVTTTISPERNQNQEHNNYNIFKRDDRLDN